MEPKDGCEELFFLTSNGSPYKQVYRKIIEAIKASNLSVTMPLPPSDHRVVISTKAAHNIWCDLKRRKINIYATVIKQVKGTTNLQMMMMPQKHTRKYRSWWNQDNMRSNYGLHYAIIFIHE